MDADVWNWVPNHKTTDLLRYRQAAPFSIVERNTSAKVRHFSFFGCTHDMREIQVNLSQ